MELLWFLFFILKLYIPSTQGCQLWMCDAPENHALLVHSDGRGIHYPDIVNNLGPMCKSNPKREEDNFKAIDIPERGSVIAACPGEKYKNSWVDLPENKFKNFEKSSITLTCHNDRLMTKDIGSRRSRRSPGSGERRRSVSKRSGGLRRSRRIASRRKPKATSRNGEETRTVTREIDWSDLECSRRIYPSVVISGMSCADQQGHIITIGWKIDEKMTVPQIEICFNTESEITLYAHHVIHGRYMDAKAVDPWPRRPNFRRGKVYSFNIDNLYKQDNQTIVFEKILGGHDHIVELGITDDYLARGHLSPDADFVTEAEQNATFYFVNVVPQWQGFNNGNWKKLEGATRDLAEEKEQPLNIWTGSHGVLNLPDKQGNTVPVYLGLLGNENILPVPEHMWKVVYNPTENQSVVFIGLNDIRQSNDNAFNRLCQNICSKIKWVKFENRAKKGKMICCSLHDAKKVIPILPELDDTSLLMG